MIHYKRSGAFSLIEVTIAIGIAAFCLLSIFALLPLGITTNRDSINSTIAAGLASGIVADLRAVPNGSSTASPSYGLNPTTFGTPQNLTLKEDGSKQTDPPKADYIAKITLTQAKATDPVTVYIQISQPPTAASPSVSFDAVTAIDRN